MANAKNRPATTRRQAPRVNRRVARASGGPPKLLLVFCAAVVAMFVISAPALIVLCVGMAPTAVAILTDRGPEKGTAISVAALNFAGVSFYLTDFIWGTASFDQAFALITNVFVLAVIYGAAAAGWVLVLILPPVTAIVLGVLADARLQSLRKEHRQLVDEWGEDVAGQ